MAIPVTAQRNLRRQPQANIIPPVLHRGGNVGTVDASDFKLGKQHEPATAYAHLGEGIRLRCGAPQHDLVLDRRQLPGCGQKRQPAPFLGLAVD